MTQPNPNSKQISTTKKKEIMSDVTLSNGMKISKSNYTKLKTKDLIEFGYSILTEDEVSEQVDKILKGDTDLSVIGLFCKSDFPSKKPNQ